MFLNLHIALSSLRAHKLRAVLAMLGVFLGALAFTGVQHVSQSMVRSAEIETEKLGPNLFVVVAGQSRFTHGGNVRFSGFSRNFTLSDADAVIGQTPSVVMGTPFINETMPIRAAGEATNCQVIACWPQYQEIRSFHPKEGRFFTRSEVDSREKVCVLGRTIAERLFGKPGLAEGRMVYFYNAGFRVVGVMEAKGRDISGTNQDEQVFVPLTTYMRRAANVDWVSGVFLRIADGADFSVVREAATNILRSRHSIRAGEKDDFSVLDARDSMQLQQQALDLVSTLGMITSTISFAVGGLGVLSIMVLIVQARRVEIGIRRAVGGRRSDIVRQFLFEAAVLSGVGGAFGVMVSVGLMFVVAAFSPLPFVFDGPLLVATLAGSVFIGLAAGAYPAWQASRIEILDVLRG